MSARPLVCIVEGQGERTALPLLVTRMLTHLRRQHRVAVDAERTLVTKGGDRITAPHDPARQLGIEVYVRLAAAHKPAGILVVVDAEERCIQRAPGQPALGPTLLARARAAVGGIPVGVVVANRMFESWFLADFHALRSRGHFPATARLARWAQPEALAGCKVWMRDLMGTSYGETTHQKGFAEAVSLPLRAGICRRAPSYRKLFREVDRLSREARP